MPVQNRRFRTALLAGTALTIAVIAIPNIARAANDTYDGTGAPGATTANGNFNLNTNYDTQTAPGAGDTAIFNDQANVAKTTTITFANANNPIAALQFGGTTPYTFTIGTGQTFSPTALTSASTGLQTFNLSGTGAMTIGSLTNSSTGGETFNTSGTSAVTITGADAIGGTTQTFTGNSVTIGGAFTSTGGTLDLSGVTSGTNVAGSIAGSGAIALGANTLSIGSAGSTTVYSGNITGTGGNLILTGGNLTLSGANTYSGGNSVTGGTLTLGANNAAGTGPLAIGTGATFAMATFNQTVTTLNGAGAITSSGGALTANSGTYTGNATSTGTLTKVSTGTLALLGTNTFSQTNVSAGTLQIGSTAVPNASLAGPVTVEQSAMLLGPGTINGNLINTGTVTPGGFTGTPGTVTGTLKVNGNYTSSPTSTLSVTLGQTTSSALAVSGAAQLGGALQVQPYSGATYNTGTQYQILTANAGVNGQFASTNSGVSGLFYAVTYQPTDVLLTTVNINTGNPALFSNNESNIGGAIRTLLTSSATGAFANRLTALYGTLQALDPPPQALDAIGELRADSATITLANTTAFQNFLVERMAQRQGMGAAQVANNGLPGTFDVAMNDSDMPLFGPSDGKSHSKFDPSVWVHGYGVLSDFGGEAGFGNFEARTAGIAAGADMLLGQGALVGGAVAYEHTDYNFKGDTDQNNIDTYRVSLYGSSKLDPVPLVIDGAVGYAFNDYHNNSVLPLITGTNFSQTSRHNGDTLTAETGLSHAFVVPQNMMMMDNTKLTLTPRAGVEYDNIAQNDYTTTGAGTTNIHTQGSTLNALRSTIGGKADLDIVRNDGTVVTPEVRASYLHDFMQTNITATENFTGAPGVGFNIQGLRPGKDAALAGAGVNVGFSQHFSANVSYDADVREHELDHVIQAGVKYRW